MGITGSPLKGGRDENKIITVSILWGYAKIAGNGVGSYKVLGDGQRSANGLY